MKFLRLYLTGLVLAAPLAISGPVFAQAEQAAVAAISKGVSTWTGLDPTALFALVELASVSRQCSSATRMKDRAVELADWALDPATGIASATNKKVGVLWIAGRSDMNCACYRAWIEFAGFSWRDFLVINGMGPNSRNWKMTCRI